MTAQFNKEYKSSTSNNCFSLLEDSDSDSDIDVDIIGDPITPDNYRKTKAARTLSPTRFIDMTEKFTLEDLGVGDIDPFEFPGGVDASLFDELYSPHALMGNMQFTMQNSAPIEPPSSVQNSASIEPHSPVQNSAASGLPPVHAPYSPSRQQTDNINPHQDLIAIMRENALAHPMPPRFPHSPRLHQHKDNTNQDPDSVLDADSFFLDDMDELTIDNLETFMDAEQEAEVRATEIANTEGGTAFLQQQRSRWGQEDPTAAVGSPNPHTRRHTKYATGVFNAFRAEVLKDVRPLDHEDMELNIISEQCAQFASRMRKQDGSSYKVRTLKSLIVGVQRHLNNCAQEHFETDGTPYHKVSFFAIHAIQYDLES